MHPAVYVDDTVKMKFAFVYEGISAYNKTGRTSNAGNDLKTEGDIS